MEPIMEWGVQVVLWFQQFSPALDLPFSFFTSLGNEEFFLVLLPFVYWCLDRGTGARLIILFLSSTYTNAVAKELARQPRPFQYDHRVRMIREAEGYGLPSGHTQSAVVVWGYLGMQCRRKWLWIAAVVLMILIPLSRVYLGVHFPHDLLGGYVLGAASLLVYLWFEPRAERWLSTKGLAWQLGVVIAAALLMIPLFPTEDGITASATLVGMGAGFVLERRWIGFAISSRWWRRIVSFVLGAAILVGLWLGLRIAFADLEPMAVYRSVRYGAIGLWGALGAPWMFVRLRLADVRTG